MKTTTDSTEACIVEITSSTGDVEYLNHEEAMKSFVQHFNSMASGVAKARILQFPISTKRGT